ncbi:MAG: YesL family protein [Clostridia bacterium]|nr:YesL family protein [Clostridia bacterium]
MFGANFEKPGKGVDKPDPNKPRIVLFLELLWRKLWRLLRLNVMYLVICIPTFLITMILVGLLSSRVTDFFMPILAELLGFASADMANPQFAFAAAWFDVIVRAVFAFLFTVFLGMGPATAGFTYILRNYAREEHVWLLSDFWQQTKANFKQAFIVWIIDLLVFCALVIAFDFYAGTLGALGFLKYLIFLIGIIYVIMHFYIYQHMVTFKLPLKDLFKNSLIFAVAEAPKNLALLAVLVVVHLGLPYMSVMFAWATWVKITLIVAEFLITVAVMGFMVNFFIYPTTEKYIKLADKDASVENFENEEL